MQISDDGDYLVYKAGNLSARIRKNPWSIRFFHGEKLQTGSDYRSMGYIQTGDDDLPEYGFGGSSVYMREQLSLEGGRGRLRVGGAFHRLRQERADGGDLEQGRGNRERPGL